MRTASARGKSQKASRPYWIRTIDAQRTNVTTPPPEASACGENWRAKAVTPDIVRRGDGGGACPDHQVVASHKPG